jgi:hypothetical protein
MEADEDPEIRLQAMSSRIPPPPYKLPPPYEEHCEEG